jgi:hypothetical protein
LGGRCSACALQDREKAKELELIKQQYLGGEKVKKKILKPSEKFKFNFDWGADQDTSRDLNPLYQNTRGAWHCGDHLFLSRLFAVAVDECDT